ncbi:MAG: 3',5'-cyclic-nucleotide phosphodiesterase [Gammaproteobacteria bacterium]|nr:3',5'-cyclic-nucleotide phosphodiesterase [Gammaproteobacteria bacterium]
MKLRVLGCSGGIGSALRTTSFLLDNDILIDAGTGVGDLCLDELRAIRHIFLTHSHLDHIAGLPLLVDTLLGFADKALTVHALPETLAAIQQHIFNWKIWPDFAELPDKEHPSMRYVPLRLGESVEISGRKITMLPASHTVPAAGYCISTDAGSIAFSGDTSTNDGLWHALNQINDLKYLLVECAFANKDRHLADVSRHYCPATLQDDLAKLKITTQILISHLKPGNEALIMQECCAAMPALNLRQLKGDEILIL